jgi:hypothetical protein
MSVSRHLASYSGNTANSLSGNKNEKAWNNLLRRRKSWEKNLDKVQRELDEGIEALHKLNSKSIASKLVTIDNIKVASEQDLSSQRMLFPTTKKGWKLELGQERDLQGMGNKMKCAKQLNNVVPKHSSPNVLTAADSFGRVSQFNADHSPAIPKSQTFKNTVHFISALTFVQPSDSSEKLFQKGKNTKEKMEELKETRCDSRLQTNKMSTKNQNIPARFKTANLKFTSHPEPEKQPSPDTCDNESCHKVKLSKKLNIKYHSYDRITFDEEFSILFRTNLDDSPSKVKVVATCFNLQLPVTTIHQQYLYCKNFSFLNKSELFSTSVQENLVTQVAQNFVIVPCEFGSHLKADIFVEQIPRWIVYSSSFHTVETHIVKHEKDDYKISLGALTKDDIKEIQELDKNAGDVEKATLQNSSNSGVLFNIPADLLRRWGNLYKIEKDEEEDSEYEEDDPSSAYHEETTLDVSPEKGCFKALSQFVDKAFSTEESFIQEWNETHGIKDVEIRDDVVRHLKTKEVLCLEEITWCGNVRHGFYRTLDPDGKQVLSVGRYFEDEKRGIFWKKLEGNSYLISIHDDNNNQVNKSFLKKIING